ncbi:MAG: alpha/beta hydrolase [Clostridia bacterium]|nr:alpha/beta hydrolase [Clostridia bacterium]
MINEVIYLRPENPKVTLTTYVVTDEIGTKPRPAVLVCPGGSYTYCAPHEGEKIAKKYLEEGFNAFVLNYSVKENTPDLKYPMPLVDASNAMKHIKDNAERYNIDRDKVFVCGFSAGGHLAAMLGTMWHREEVYKAAKKMEYGYNKPAGMLLCYPVIRAKEHMASFENLLGGAAADEKSLDYLAADLSVDDKTCPAFLWHTADDISVNVDSSFAMASALKSAGVMFEMHIYRAGGHGLGYPDGKDGGPRRPDVATWFERSIDWINTVCEDN